jgi:hypothetical protein
MKKVLLTTGAFFALSMPAYAATCTSTPVTLGLLKFNLQLGSNSTNLCNDGDDLKYFINEKGPVELSTVTGSLDKNSGDSKFQNVRTTANANFTAGNGYANIKEVKGSTDLTSLTFTPITPSFLDDKSMTSFQGFDGVLFRAQIGLDEPKSVFDGIVNITADFANGASDIIPFKVTRDANGDIESIGLDEITTGLLKSVTFSLDTGSFFEEVKQLDFSVTGQTPTVPLPPALALFGSGLAGMVFLARRKKDRSSVSFD